MTYTSRITATIGATLAAATLATIGATVPAAAAAPAGPACQFDVYGGALYVQSYTATGRVSVRLRRNHRLVRHPVDRLRPGHLFVFTLRKPHTSDDFIVRVGNRGCEST